MANLFLEELYVVGGGWPSWQCKCWCQSSSGYVYEHSWASGKDDCERKFYFSYSDFWFCNYPPDDGRRGL